MTNAELRKRRNRVAQLRRYRRTAAEFRRLGLSLGRTNWGKPTVYKRHDFGDVHGRARDVLRKRFYRDRLVEQGLTTNGKPRKTMPHNLGNISRREKKLYYNKLVRRRYVARGLTAAGKPRKLGPTPLELEWRKFRETITIPEPPELLTWCERSEAA